MPQKQSIRERMKTRKEKRDANSREMRRGKNLIQRGKILKKEPVPGLRITKTAMETLGNYEIMRGKAALDLQKRQRRDKSALWQSALWLKGHRMSEKRAERVNKKLEGLDSLRYGRPNEYELKLRVMRKKMEDMRKNTNKAANINIDIIIHDINRKLNLAVIMERGEKAVRTEKRYDQETGLKTRGGRKELLKNAKLKDNAVKKSRNTYLGKGSFWNNLEIGEKISGMHPKEREKEAKKYAQLMFRNRPLLITNWKANPKTLKEYEGYYIKEFEKTAKNYRAASDFTHEIMKEAGFYR